MIAAIIPSRMDSKRFPRKALKHIDGVPLIQRVYEGCQGARVDEVWVATPDRVIYDLVEGFGGRATITGTHSTMHGRVVEANRRIKADIVLLVQGDEPMVLPGVLDQALEGQWDTGATMIVRSLRWEEQDPKNIRVIVDNTDVVRYITREQLPGVRYKAVGVKAFDAAVLDKFPTLPIHATERAEGIEELRFVMNGYTMRAVETRCEMFCVDTQEDLEKVRDVWMKSKIR